MPEAELPENDFRLLSISNTDITTLTAIKIDGILRNLDATNTLVFVTEGAGDDVAAIIADATTAKNHKLILGPKDEVIIKNFRKLFVQAVGGTILMQWIPIRFIN